MPVNCSGKVHSKELREVGKHKAFGSLITKLCFNGCTLGQLVDIASL